MRLWIRDGSQLSRKKSLPGIGIKRKVVRNLIRREIHRKDISNGQGSRRVFF